MARFNFKGWSLKEWFLGNGKTLKEIAKVTLPLCLAYWSVTNPILITLITLLGKLFLDSMEFFIKK